MSIADVKNEIINNLKDMGCTDVTFPLEEENHIIVTFNCKVLTSFKAELSGWTYSGIQLDPTNNRQFKIEFSKNK